MAARRGYILLMSHMRSCSTLLAHLLGSHSEIDGYAELLQHYESPVDLLGMTRRIEAHTGTPRRGRYALDKLLHNRGIVDPGILRRHDVKVVFLLRNARDTLPSIVRASVVDDKVAPSGMARGARRTTTSRASSSSTATASSSARVRRSSRPSGCHRRHRRGPRGAHSLPRARDAALARRTARFKHTGVRGIGDPGKNILAGRVLRGPRARSRRGSGRDPGRHDRSRGRGARGAAAEAARAPPRALAR